MEPDSSTGTEVSRNREQPGQRNLFTGELEPIAASDADVPETGWLFDPDWGVLLPENPAGREIVIGGQGPMREMEAGSLRAGRQRWLRRCA
jgi:hypothetical protein